MFFTYVGRELRRRRRQAIVVALGLALGVGLVVTVAAMAGGVRTAQASVLKGLYGVGTDITVTQSADAGTGARARFGLNAPTEEKRGKRFSRDDILPLPGLDAMPSGTVAKLAALEGVEAVSGGLSLTSIHAEGQFPDQIEFAPAVPGANEQPVAVPSVAPINVNSYSITGVDVTNREVGPLSPDQITSGRYFGSSETNAAVAILDRSYAKQKKLTVGSTLTINGTTYEVIGIASSAAGAEASNVYLPLARAQKLAGLSGKVNRIYVKATSASQIGAVKAAIEDALPKATVTTADDVASQVTGSLANASSLARNLGTWLSVAALIAAFAVASLLTMGAVGRRVREFGTLKAMGWRTRRVVGQVMGEAVVQGILGGVLGIGVGLSGAYLVSKLAPTLQATVGEAAGRLTALGGPPGGGPLGQALGGGQTVSVPLQASVDANLLALAIGLALLGGVVAGCLGGWRAARLRPAEALRRVE